MFPVHAQPQLATPIASTPFNVNKITEFKPAAAAASLNVNAQSWTPSIKKQPAVAQQTIAEITSAPFIPTSAPAPAVTDPLTKNLREVLKLPEEQIKSLKEILDKISAAKNESAEARFKLLKEDLKNSAICKDSPSTKLYWQG
jgi:hypothetical protein